MKQLEQQKSKTEKEIQIAQKLLGDTEKKKEQTVNNLAILKRQVQLRNRLIKETEAQIVQIEKEIENNLYHIHGLSNELNNLKREYARLINFAWKNRSTVHLMMFFLASSDFNEAYGRIKFYKQLLKFRTLQAKEIENTQNQINNEVQKQTQLKEALIVSENQRKLEQKALQADTKKYNKLYQTLQAQETKLKKEIEEQKKVFEAINKTITAFIAEEARKAKESKATIRDARYLKLSDGFQGNKGKLPWPLKNGVITSSFGENKHPLLKVTTKNDGVTITTSPNEKIRSVYEGEVTMIASIPGANTAVVIRHGDFLTLYTNLKKVNVKVGQSVQPQQEIGEIYTDNSGKAVLNFQIWKENKPENPQNWLLP